MTGLLKLNCGSGQRPFDRKLGWTNIDAQERWQPDLVCDAAHLPYEAGSAGIVVLHHVLEHFGCGEGLGLLQEAHRVLAPGGSLLVFVPDLQAMCQRWLAGSFDTQLFMTSVYGAYMGDEADRHKWGFTNTTLHKAIQDAACANDGGWAGIRTFDWRHVNGADLARDWWILAREAVR